jgi:Mitochondrial carrier protein
MSTEYFLYGYMGGMMGVLASHPIDTMKTNIQKGQPILIHQLYRGLLPPLLGVGLEKSIVFGVYETTRPYTKNDILSGALAGSCASFVVTPFERLKILLQTGQTFTHRNLFQGLSATFSRETPGFAIYFYTYNKLKQDRQLSPFHNFLHGALAGIASWVFIYPQDRIKTCIQSSRDKNIRFMEALQMIHNEKGVISFYKGFHYALLRAVPLHATAFMTVEYCKTYLGK